METERQRIEQEQWDKRASEFTVSEDDDLMVGESHPDLNSHLLKAISLLGDVSGKKVLECGCGSGVTTVHLARMGAEVYSFDLSSELVEITKRRAKLNGFADRVHIAQMPFERLEFPEGFFDLAFGNMVLHHVDCESAGRELSRVLKQGGRAIFAETSGRNRLLMFARRHLVGRCGIDKYSTDGEKPLEKPELEALEKHFGELKLHYMEFIFLTTACSNILKWRSSTRLLQKLLLGADNLIYKRIPFLRRYSYLMVVELMK